ncbi:MAG TPA: alpha/beta fold hydrolase [Thermoanaerobaculia bacterium]|nr:alpha/beta fold hydrolase [Thermoanaerobaculia bacterium]
MNIRQFTIESSEGLPIRGTLSVPRDADCLVLVIHGFKGFRQWGFFPWICEHFGRADIASVRFDMSRNGVGESSEQFDRLDLFEDDTYSVQIEDLRSIDRFVNEDDALRDLPRVVLGHSRGGAIALLGSKHLSRLRGVVTWASISRVDRWDEATRAQWLQDGFQEVLNQRTGQRMRVSLAMLEDFERDPAGLNVLEAAKGLEVPLLAIHGSIDESVAVEESRAIAREVRNSSLLVIEGAGHTFGAIHPLIDVPFALRLAATVTQSFIRAHSLRGRA